MDIDDLLVIAEELRISDADQRRHVENIHIAITTLIIASFVTPAVQDTIQELNIEFHTNILFSVAIVYLAVRLIDTTIPIRRYHNGLDWIFGFIAPLGFLFSVLTYLMFLGVAVFDISISATEASVIVIIAVIVSVGLAALNSKYGEKDTESSVSRQSIQRVVMDFESYVFNNPEVVEPGLSWEAFESREGQILVDLVGRDEDGRIVYGELKLGDIDIQRASTVVRQYNSLFGEREPDEERFLLITNGEISNFARQIIDEYSIEIKRVDYEIDR